MPQEPILKEIRRIRHEIEAEYQNDPQKYHEHIQQVQKQYCNRLARPSQFKGCVSSQASKFKGSPKKVGATDWFVRRHKPWAVVAQEASVPVAPKGEIRHFPAGYSGS